MLHENSFYINKYSHIAIEKFIMYQKYSTYFSLKFIQSYFESLKYFNYLFPSFLYQILHN